MSSTTLPLKRVPIEIFEHDLFGQPHSKGLQPEVDPLRIWLMTTARICPANPDSSYYRARYYDPNAGRFLSEDPIEFGGGVNFYRYVDNGPQDWVDPAGLETAQACCRPLNKFKIGPVRPLGL